MSTLNTHTDLKHKRQVKDTGSVPQDQFIYNFLKEHTVTASQLEAVTEIKQKNICRYKRILEKQGLLMEFKFGRCPVTGHCAWTLTTDPDKMKIPFMQLNLFDDGI